MRNAFLILLLTAMYVPGLACSFYTPSLCEYHTDLHTIVFRGKIVARSQHASLLQILDLYQGVESRPLITMWDGIPFDCNGTFPNSAIEIGDIGDTLILALPKIPAGGASQWQRPGDYAYDVFLPKLWQHGDSVLGLHDHNGERRFGYVAYDDFLAHTLSCLPGAAVHQPPVTLPATGSSVLAFHTSSWIGYQDKDLSATEIDLYDISGRIVARKSIVDPLTTIDLARLAPGIYVVLIKGEGILRREKILVTRD